MHARTHARIDKVEELRKQVLAASARGKGDMISVCANTRNNPNNPNNQNKSLINPLGFPTSTLEATSVTSVGSGDGSESATVMVSTWLCVLLVRLVNEPKNDSNISNKHT